MNLQEFNLLDGSLAAARRLLSLLEEDRERMPRCVNGEILTQYLRGTEEAIRQVTEIREELVALQAENAIGL